jgi:hypothetical protein
MRTATPGNNRQFFQCVLRAAAGNVQAAAEYGKVLSSESHARIRWSILFFQCNWNLGATKTIASSPVWLDELHILRCLVHFLLDEFTGIVIATESVHKRNFGLGHVFRFADLEVQVSSTGAVRCTFAFGYRFRIGVFFESSATRLPDGSGK